MAILIKKTGEVLAWPVGERDATAIPKGTSLIADEHWDMLTKEKGSEEAVVAALKAVDTRQPSEKRPVPVLVKEAEEGIKTK